MCIKPPSGPDSVAPPPVFINFQPDVPVYTIAWTLRCELKLTGRAGHLVRSDQALQDCRPRARLYKWFSPVTPPMIRNTKHLRHWTVRDRSRTRTSVVKQLVTAGHAAFRRPDREAKLTGASCRERGGPTSARRSPSGIRRRTLPQPGVTHSPVTAWPRAFDW